jgi:chemotaxis protein MotB
MNKNREVPIHIIVRKKKHTGGHHGGAWKVAFADFMTAMFALFLVLWLVNQSSDVKSAIAGYFKDPLGRASEHGSSILPGDGAQTASVRLTTQEDVLDMRRNRLSHAAKRIQKSVTEAPELAPLRGFMEIDVSEEGLRIELIEDLDGVFFQTGVATPSREGRQTLALLGLELGTLPFPVRIEGHTDAWPYRGGGTYTNWELSTDRANAARRILTEHGLRPTQIREVTGLAERQPRIRSDPYAPSNRRITITMLLTDEQDLNEEQPKTRKSSRLVRR